MNPGERTQTASGLLRLDDFAALRVSGEDRVDFLQGQLTQDMGRVTPSRAAPAAWCNRQGRVLCLMVAVSWQDAIFLVLPSEMAESCMSGLSRYILRAKVRVERWPGGEAGPPSSSPGRPGSREGNTVRAMPSLPGIFGCAGFEGLGADPWTCREEEGYCALRLPGSGERALLLGEPPPHLRDTDSGWTPEDWRLADIEAELPWIGEKTSGKFLAHSLNLDLSGAVSFTKGCFVGQEIIARMEYRGTPKRRMRRVEIPAGSALKAGERVDLPQHGTAAVISWASSRGNIEALAEIRLAQDGAQHREQQ